LPATYKACSEAITRAVDADKWQRLGEFVNTKPTVNRPAAVYKSFETEVVIKDKAYRAVVIHSSAHDKRRQKRIDRQLAQERKDLEKHCKEADKKFFYCEADARVAKQALLDQKMQYYQIGIKIEERPKYQRGRPKDGVQKISEMRYGLRCSLIENQAAIARLKEEAGCFVMITNVPEKGENGYDSRAILRAYKDQYGIEQNFGFLKDPMIVNSIFLKKPQRIEVLGLVLLISLLIWRLIERSMRKFVEKGDQTLPGWKKRRTTRPTTFMLMTKFQGLMVLKIGFKRKLKKPLKPQQMEYLFALGVSPDAFTSVPSG